MMRALIRDRGTVRLAEVARPALERPDDVLVRVACAGICRTDIYVAEGRIPVVEPRVLGHEACGVVEAVGPAVGSLRPGDAVAAMPLWRCGSCSACLRGAACVDPQVLGVDLDGAFAEWLVVPERHLFACGGLSMRLAAYVEPMAASMAVLDVGLPERARGLVCRTSRIGELTRRVLEHAGFERISVWDPRVDPPPPAGEFDFAIETAATGPVLSQLLESLRVGGTLVLKSRPFAPVPLDVTAAVTRRVTIATACHADATSAIATLRAHGDLVGDLLGAAVPLEDYALAFASDESTKRFLCPWPDAERGWREARATS